MILKFKISLNDNLSYEEEIFLDSGDLLPDSIGRILYAGDFKTLSEFKVFSPIDFGRVSKATFEKHSSDDSGGLYLLKNIERLKINFTLEE